MTSTDSAAIPIYPARQMLSRLLLGYRRRVLLIAVSSVIGGLVEAVFLVLMTRAAFAVTSGSRSLGVLAGRTMPVAGAMLLATGLVVLRMALALLANWLSASVTVAVTSRTRERLGGAFLAASWSVQRETSASRFQELTSSSASAAGIMVQGFTTGVVSACSVGAMLLLAIGVDPLGSLVGVAGVGSLGFLLRPLRSKVRSHARRANEDNLRLAAGANEVAELGLAVRIFGVQGPVKARFVSFVRSARRSNRTLNLVAGMVPVVYSGFAYLVLVGAVSLASVSSTAKLTSLGAVMLVMLRSLAYGQQVQNAYTGVHSNLPRVAEVFREIEYLTHSDVSAAGEPVGEVGALEVRDVSFRYNPHQLVLKSVSASVAPKEMVGIVGPSGSGKSTLVQLFLGLRDPSEGAVLAGGRDIRLLDRHEWSQRVTFVPQAPALLSDSVRENIRFFRVGVSDAEVERAARSAGLHDEILRFADGYGHQVGDRGGNLSGGQQQRLCIARALCGDPEVLILDEPTSALDPQSEALIRRTLDGLRHRMTIIVIAHRLSTIDSCDRIMVIQNGALTAFDTPEALRATSDFYADAVRLSGLA
ncbi:MAG: ABC transporter ATP-binding protein [Actinomycetota bacterium]|nr:ABC transporter ATP-binding protein [Actinomycetota bacterium]